MKYALLIFLLAATPAATWGADSLVVVADGAAFFNPENNTAFVEVYFGLFRHQLGFISSGKGATQFAGVYVAAVASDSTGKAVDSASTYFVSQAKDSSEKTIKGIRLFDMLPMKLQPGKYHVLVSAIDNVSKMSGSARFDLTVPAFSPGIFQSSDIELAYEIKNVADSAVGSTNPRLLKEGREVFPNPSSVYSFGSGSQLYIYSELYGLQVDKTPPQGFSIRYQVKDDHGNVMTDFGEHKFAKPGATAVLSQALDISELGPGKYRLLLIATDHDAGSETVAARSFAIVDTASVHSGIADPSDVDLMVDIAYYYLSEAEKLQLNYLSSEGKKSFIKQFWQSKDDDPTTPDNPVYNNAVQRFNYAVEQYSTRSDLKDGWKTDRGRVYITYGPPDMVEDVPISSHRQPYTKWTYYQIEGGVSTSGNGVIFIFSNDYIAGAVDYRLVHSNHPHEKYSAVWQRILDNQADGSDDDMR